MLDAETRKRIDNARDILVGKIPVPNIQVEQITLALLYKFMDDIDNQTVILGGNPTYFTGEYAKYSFRSIMSKEVGSQARFNLYAESLERLYSHKDLPQTFKDIFKNATIPYKDPETLTLFLKQIEQFSYEDSEKLGDAYEYLLNILGSQGGLGQFRTPRHIIDFIVKVVDPNKDSKILDPACGTAGFLISAYKYILKKNKKNIENENELGLDYNERVKILDNITGYDIEPSMVKIAEMNMFLHGCNNPKIHEYDTLTSDEKWDDKFDIILANPPFMTPKGGITPHKRFSVKANRSEVLFVDYIMEHLKRDGRAGIIVPEGIVFQSGNAYKELRKQLINTSLYAVISLPAGVFNPYSGVKTSILLLDKELAKKTDNILFVKIENDGYSLGAQRKEVSDGQLEEAVELIKKHNTREEISNNKLINIVPKFEILKNTDITLVGDRYLKSIKLNSNYNSIKIKDFAIFEKKSNLKSGEGLKHSTYKMFISSNIQYKYYSDYIYDDECLIFGTGGNASVHYYNGKFATSTDCIVLKNINKDINLKYIYNMLKSNINILENGFKGIGIKHISKGYIEELEIPLPTIEVQNEIVQQIEQYQNIIDGARQVVNNWKPSIDLSDNIKYYKIEDLVEFNPKKTEVTKLKKDLKVSFVPMASVNEKNHKMITSEKRQLGEVYSNYTYFKENDVILARVTPCFENGKSAIAKGLENGIGFGSSEFFVFRVKENKILNKWLYYFISSEEFINRGKNNMTGTSGLQRLSREFVLNYEIPVISMEEQEKIIAMIESEELIIEQNKKMIEIYEMKIKEKINSIWGE